MADATMSMGNYLKNTVGGKMRRGRKKTRAFYYNRSEVYVNTVLMVYDALTK